MSNYSEGSMKGSGIFADEFEYGDFTCEEEECQHENKDAIAYVDDWGEYTVSCEKCNSVYTSGNRSDDARERAMEEAYDMWKDEQ